MSQDVGVRSKDAEWLRHHTLSPGSRFAGRRRKRQEPREPRLAEVNSNTNSVYVLRVSGFIKQRSLMLPIWI